MHPLAVREDEPAVRNITLASFTMMVSVSPFGPVGCGRPLKGARRQRHTTAHNGSIEACGLKPKLVLELYAKFLILLSSTKKPDFDNK
jgi:hypothetical protein